MPFFKSKKRDSETALQSDAGSSEENAVILPENAGSQPEEIYDTAVFAMEKAYSEAAFLAAAERFQSIPGFRDADALAEECLEKAEIYRKDTAYTAAKEQQRKRTLSGYKSAAKLYRTIPGWKDADQQLASVERKAGNRKIAYAVIFSVVGLAAAALVVYITLIVPALRYRDAQALYQAGRYREAIYAFKNLEGYKDSEDMILVCETAIRDQRYDYATAMMNEGRYKAALAEFTSLDGYKDSAEKIPECRYAYAEELFSAGRYKEAVTEYMLTGKYRDSRERADEAYILHKETELYKAEVGDYVLFGAYEQDNDKSDGKEYIEWRVLEKSGENMFLISSYALDCRKYNEEEIPVTWEDCDLRNWLNGDFYSNAFSPEEQGMIQTSAVAADENPEYATPAGNDTEDRVFLLSLSEVEEYASLDYARQCKVTDYCIAQGAYAKGTYRISGDSIGWWWLRTPGRYSVYTAYTLTDGSVYGNGRSVISEKGTVRPAMRIGSES